MLEIVNKDLICLTKRQLIRLNQAAIEEQGGSFIFIRSIF